MVRKHRRFTGQRREFGPFVASVPGVCGGRPVVEGTRVATTTFHVAGESVERLAKDFGVSPTGVEAAIASEKRFEDWRARRARIKAGLEKPPAREPHGNDP